VIGTPRTGSTFASLDRSMSALSAVERAMARIADVPYVRAATQTPRIPSAAIRPTYVPALRSIHAGATSGRRSATASAYGFPRDASCGVAAERSCRLVRVQAAGGTLRQQARVAAVRVDSTSVISTKGRRGGQRCAVQIDPAGPTLWGRGRRFDPSHVSARSG
jgi:hypothetical protein